MKITVNEIKKIIKEEYSKLNEMSLRCDEKTIAYAKRGMEIQPFVFLRTISKSIKDAKMRGRKEYPEINNLNNWEVMQYMYFLSTSSSCLKKVDQNKIKEKMEELSEMCSMAQNIIRQNFPNIEKETDIRQFYTNLDITIGNLNSPGRGMEITQMKVNYM